MKNQLLLAFLTVGSGACAAKSAGEKDSAPIPGSNSSIDAREEIKKIRLPELEICLLDPALEPPSILGGPSPGCASRTSFTPGGLEPERTDGDLGVILMVSPGDQSRLSDFSAAHANQSAVLLKSGKVVKNLWITGERVTELHISFATESESDLFFRTLFAE